MLTKWNLGIIMLSLGFNHLAAEPRLIELYTKKLDDNKTHWMPKEIKVKAGEKIKIVAKHELDGGYDFHGLYVPELKISTEVHRHKPVTIEKDVPLDLDGKYKIQCHLHSTHEPATLIVEGAKKKATN